MGWKDSLLDASFRGVTFDCLQTQDAIQNDLTSHEYPYLHGADVEDLGRKARRIAMTAVFFGEDYGDRLADLTKALKQLGPGGLVHPVFGSVPEAQVADFQVRHDADSPDYCTVELNFVVATPSNPFFVQQLPAQRAAAVTQQAVAVRSAAIGVFARAMAALGTVKGVMARLNGLRAIVTATLGAVRGLVQGVIGAVLDVIRFPQAFAADVVSMFAGLVDLRAFDGDVLGDWSTLRDQLGDVVRLPTREVEAASTADAVWAGGSALPDNPAAGGSVVPALLPMGMAKLWPVGSAPTSRGTSFSNNLAGGSLPLAPTSRPVPVALADVQPLTRLLQTLAVASLAEAAATVLAAEAETPTLSPPEVEAMVSDVRLVVNAAIEHHRASLPLEEARPVIEALKTLALDVQQAAVAVIQARPPLLQRRVTVAGNLHLQAFRWYGDYSRAAELARLNPTLRNPNALQPGDVLNAFAR